MMSAGQELTATGLPVPLGLLIDRACEQLEQSWKNGKPCRAEEFIEQLPQDHRPAALRRLLHLEMKLATESGMAASQEQLQKRFPDQLALVESVWRRVFEETEPRYLVAGETVVESLSTATRYRDIRRFRTGGIGELFLAHDEELRRDTVVKRLRKQFQGSPEFASQLGLEAEITGRLDHPGIVPVYGVGQDWDGQPFYVMRMIRGDHLHAAISKYHDAGGPSNQTREGRQQLFDLLEHLISACNTVAYAHDAGVLHCDLKPQNVMVGRYGETFVIDWGLARPFSRNTEFRRAAEPTLHLQPGSGSDSRGCTLGYVSPEQFIGEAEIGPASDIYSLGATLYQILTNRTQLEGCPKAEYEHRLLAGTIVPPRQINPRVPRILETICLKAMHLSPGRRHRTAKELAADLQNWMHDEEVESAPDSSMGRLFRWARHHRAIAMASVATLLAALIAGVVSYSSWRYAVVEAAHAEHAKDLQRQAETHFETALNTFEQLCVPLVNEEKTNLKLFAPLAQKIVDFTDQFVSDPAQRLSEAVDDKQFARLLELDALARSTEDREQRLKKLQTAQTKYEALLKQKPADIDLTRRLADNELLQGRWLLLAGKSDDAKKVLEPALAGFQSRHPQLAGDERQILHFRRREAETLHALGECEMALADTSDNDAHFRQSENYFDKSRRLREDLLQTKSLDDPGSLNRDLARSYGYLGDLYLRRGAVDRAFQAYQQSLKTRKQLWKDHAGDPEHRFQYARGLANFSAIEEVEKRDFEPALRQLDEAIGIAEGLRKEFPSDPSFRSDLGWMLNRSAEMHLIRHDFVVARQLLSRARAVLGSLKASDAETIRSSAVCDVLEAEALQESGSPVGGKNPADLVKTAIERLTVLEKKGDLSQNDLFFLGLAQAMLGDVDSAIESLETAVLRGCNTAQRFQAHQELGLRSLLAQQNSRDRLEKCVREASAKIDGAQGSDP